MQAGKTGWPNTNHCSSWPVVFGVKYFEQSLCNVPAHTHTHMHTHTHAHMHTHTRTHTHTCRLLCTIVSLYIRVAHLCRCASFALCAHTHIHTHTHTHHGSIYYKELCWEMKGCLFDNLHTLMLEAVRAHVSLFCIHTHTQTRTHHGSSQSPGAALGMPPAQP